MSKTQSKKRKSSRGTKTTATVTPGPPLPPQKHLASLNLSPIIEAARHLLKQMEAYEEVVSINGRQLTCLRREPLAGPALLIVGAWGSVPLALLGLERAILDAGLRFDDANPCGPGAVAVSSLLHWIRERRADAGNLETDDIGVRLTTGLWANPGSRREYPDILHELDTLRRIVRLFEGDIQPPPSPPPPLDSELTFLSGAFMYRGREHRLQAKPRQVLEAIYQAQHRTLTLNELFDKVWGKENPRGDEAVRSAVCAARMALRSAIKAAGLTGPRDPLRCIERGPGSTAWRLELP